METQFQKHIVAYLDSILYQVMDQEQTLEFRLPDGMPDIGRVLGVWGQPLVRSKEWQSDSVRVNSGVMVWALYAPEEGGPPKCAQAWIPFQQTFSHNADSGEGIMQVQCCLRSVDARTVSARKLMFRAVIHTLAQAWVETQADTYTPGELPEDVCMLTNTYPVSILKEAGEKPFVMDEELTLPSGAPVIQDLIRYDLRCELIDQKILTDKVVFRGVGVLHILYTGEDGLLYNCDLEVPFSQYGNLKGEYPENAAADICIAITGLELDADAEGRLRLKAGLTGQYTVCAEEKLLLAQDAYSPGRTVSLQQEMLQLPAVLDKDSINLPVQQSISDDIDRIVDVAFYPDHPRCSREQDKVRAELSGVFHILSMDPEGQLRPVQLRWQGEHLLNAAKQSDVRLRAAASAEPLLNQTADGKFIACDMILTQETLATQGVTMLTGLELGQEQEPDPQRPSLILRRAGEESLWELAKESGSTVEAICRANGITDDADLQQQMLLIPVS